MLLSLIALLALTRAEIVQRMRAPVITRADGMVRVYANCPEDMRREYQGPVAGFASDTVELLYRGLSMKPLRFAHPAIYVYLGDVRTNDTELVTRVATNGTEVVSRLYLKSPGYVDLSRFRLEVIRAFYRAVKGQELTEEEAIAAYRAADPQLRIADLRGRIEAWLAGAADNDEEILSLMRRVIEPGVASRRDVLTFASRLYIYPRTFDEKFADGSDVLDFREAIALAKRDVRVRILAIFKADELPVWGGGRSEELNAAAALYTEFLRMLGAGGRTDAELSDLLNLAENKLKEAYAKAGK